MADEIFANPRLAKVYDAFEGRRADLAPYLAIVSEIEARSVLDIGCGTGSLASLLAGAGAEVTGVDPAAASLDIARTKPHAETVRWLHGDATSLPPLSVDVAVMTGNVSQVFITDDQWAATLAGIATAVRAGGHLVFETRDPADMAWLDWNRDSSHRRLDIPGIGVVTTWVEVTEISPPLISFEWRYHFEADDLTLSSTSTLRFRERDELEGSLASAGFAVEEVRDAPDRPGKEWVFLARKAG